jgi:activator of 2-hydroxyglutaryl-CoA dehydratase
MLNVSLPTSNGLDEAIDEEPGEGSTVPCGRQIVGAVGAALLAMDDLTGATQRTPRSTPF